MIALKRASVYRGIRIPMCGSSGGESVFARARRRAAFYNWITYEFWRFVFIQQTVAKIGEGFIEIPSMQKPASFNLEAVKEQLLTAVQWRAGQ